MSWMTPFSHGLYRAINMPSSRSGGSLLACLSRTRPVRFVAKLRRLDATHCHERCARSAPGRSPRCACAQTRRGYTTADAGFEQRERVNRDRVSETACEAASRRDARAHRRATLRGNRRPRLFDTFTIQWQFALPMFPIGMAIYYLAWKYLVGFLNNEVGIA